MAHCGASWGWAAQDGALQVVGNVEPATARPLNASRPLAHHQSTATRLMADGARGAASTGQERPPGTVGLAAYQLRAGSRNDPGRDVRPSGLPVAAGCFRFRSHRSARPRSEPGRAVSSAFPASVDARPSDRPVLNETHTPPETRCWCCDCPGCSCFGRRRGRSWGCCSRSRRAGLAQEMAPSVLTKGRRRMSATTPRVSPCAACASHDRRRGRISSAPIRPAA